MVNKVFRSRKAEDVLIALYRMGCLGKTELREAAKVGGQTAEDVLEHFSRLGIVEERYVEKIGRNIVCLTEKGKRVAEYLLKIYETLGLSAEVS